MNSYFNAGYHDWQSSELHHYAAANRFCSSPSLPPSGTSQSGNLPYPANNGYHSYIHSNASPQLSYANSMGYGALPPSSPSHRYGDSAATSRAMFGSHAAAAAAAGSALASFPNSNLQSHLYGDHIVFGNLSTHYPVSASELTYSEIASQPSSEHLVAREPHPPGSPENLSSADAKSVVGESGECPVGENGHINYPSACAKLSASAYETSPILGPKEGSSQQSQHTFEDSSPASTPDLTNGPASALQQSSKAFFPWMKSYTGTSFIFLFYPQSGKDKGALLQALSRALFHAH